MDSRISHSCFLAVLINPRIRAKYSAPIEVLKPPDTFCLHFTHSCCPSFLVMFCNCFKLSQVLFPYALLGHHFYCSLFLVMRWCGVVFLNHHWRVAWSCCCCFCLNVALIRQLQPLVLQQVPQAKLMRPCYDKLYPYILAGIGSSFNRASNYSINAPLTYVI